MREDLCLCASIPKVELRTRVVVAMHSSERCKPTNSVRLLALANDTTRVVLVGALPPEPPPGFDRSSAVVLFPESDAMTLTSSFVQSLPSPLTLVVPDGSWRQARKIAHRYQPLMGLKRVQLPMGLQTGYTVRKHQKEGGLCTLEAIAAALDIIEGGSAGETLRQLCNEMVRRVMWTRNGGGRALASTPLPVLP